MGLYDGWQGLLGEAEPWLLDEVTVQKWDRDGGTQLGSSRTNPFSRRGPEGQKIDLSHQVLSTGGQVENDLRAMLSINAGVLLMAAAYAHR